MRSSARGRPALTTSPTTLRLGAPRQQLLTPRGRQARATCPAAPRGHPARTTRLAPPRGRQTHATCSRAPRGHLARVTCSPPPQSRGLLAHSTCPAAPRGMTGQHPLPARMSGGRRAGRRLPEESPGTPSPPLRGCPSANIPVMQPRASWDKPRGRRGKGGRGASCPDACRPRHCGQPSVSETGFSHCKRGIRSRQRGSETWRR